MPPGDAVSVETTTPGSQAVRIRKRRDGHFIANAKVNGQAMSLLVDTGASTVVLREADAVRLGVDTRRLTYTVPVQTANGITYAAHVRLHQHRGRHDPDPGGRCPRRQARRAAREPARYDFLKPSAVI